MFALPKPHRTHRNHLLAVSPVSLVDGWSEGFWAEGLSFTLSQAERVVLWKCLFLVTENWGVSCHTPTQETLAEINPPA